MGKLTKIKPDYFKLVIKKGLDLKISGRPVQELSRTPVPVKRVAVLGGDYPGLKPSLSVKVGSKVKLGEVLFTDKRNPGVFFTSPGAGKVVEINRGDKRKLISVVIELSGTGQVPLKKYPAASIKKLKTNDVIDNLVKSGLWTAIRTRPFGFVPDPKQVPRAFFINAADTNPHAPDPALFLNRYESEFATGVAVLSKLSEGKTYVAYREGVSLPDMPDGNVVKLEVSGPHPSGNVGTHIHFAEPVGPQKTVWYMGYQDVIAVGHLFKTGAILTERMVSVAGPAVKDPGVILTRLGASIDEISKGKYEPGDVRVVSGSLLSGHTASGPAAYLGRFHQQVSIIKEGRSRHFLGWMSPGFRKFSLRRVFLSSFFKPSEFDFTTSTNGSPRAIIPIGVYEDVMPMDINPTYLLRTILTGDIEYAEELGILELEEEDLSLCTFVSPGKEDFGLILRGLLNRIAKGE